jgi:hypothetical protein
MPVIAAPLLLNCSNNCIQQRPTTARLGEIPGLLWTLKVRCHIHKSLSPNLILSQMNPVHILTSYSFKILIFFSYLGRGRPSGLFPSAFLIKISYVPKPLCSPPNSLSLIYLPNNIRRKVQVTNFFLSLPISSAQIFLLSVLKHPRFLFFTQGRRPSFSLIQTG